MVTLETIKREKTAVMAAIVLVFIAVYREYAPIGQIRAMLVELSKFGLIMMFAIFLFNKTNFYAVALLIIAFISARHPKLTVYSLNAFQLLVVGLGWYAALMYFFGNNEKLLNYALCLIATIHTIGVVSGGHFMPNPNEASALLAMCLSSFLLFSGFWKIFVLVPLIGIFKIQSFNGIFAAMIVFFVYGIYLTPKIWYAYVYFLACGIALYWDQQIVTKSTQERLSWWIPAIKDYWAQPWGCGIGNWKVRGQEMFKLGQIPNGCLRLHNTWLEGLREMGIPFACLVFFYLVRIIGNLRNIHIAHILGIIAFLVVSSTNSLFKMNIINGMIAIALLVRLELEINRTRNQPG